MSPDSLDHAQIRRHFSEHADDYDRYARVQKKVATELVQSAVTIPPVGPVLDVGTGTGAVGNRLKECYPEVCLTVSDLAHEMTYTANNNLPGTSAVDADARLLPFRSGTFDLVLSASVYQWVEDLEGAFLESYRVLQPGGRFAFALFSDGTLCELEDVFRRALQAHCPERPFHFQSFPDAGTVQTSMRAVGFKQVVCEVSHEAEYHDSVRDLLISLKKIGAQNASSDRPTGLFPRRVMAEMDRLYRQKYQTRDGLCASYKVIYAVGQKI